MRGIGLNPWCKIWTLYVGVQTQHIEESPSDQLL